MSKENKSQRSVREWFGGRKRGSTPLDVSVDNNRSEYECNEDEPGIVYGLQSQEQTNLVIGVPEGRQGDNTVTRKEIQSSEKRNSGPHT